jgi:hypothetical protein
MGLDIFLDAVSGLEVGIVTEFAQNLFGQFGHQADIAELAEEGHAEFDVLPFVDENVAAF